MLKLPIEYSSLKALSLTSDTKGTRIQLTFEVHNNLHIKQSANESRTTNDHTTNVVCIKEVIILPQTVLYVTLVIRICMYQQQKSKSPDN